MFFPTIISVVISREADIYYRNFNFVFSLAIFTFYSFMWLGTPRGCDPAAVEFLSLWVFPPNSLSVFSPESPKGIQNMEWSVLG